MTDKFAANRYYVEYEDQLKDLHRLIAEGKGDADEADALREEMERPERELTREEIERLSGLSADLYMLQDDEIYAPLEPGEGPSERAPERLRGRLQEAWERGDAEAMLALLRKGTAGFSEHQRAYLRARAYETLGHLDTALLFMRYADEHAPKDITYKVQILDLLGRLGRGDQMYEWARAFIEQVGSPPELLIQSAGVLYGSTRGMTPEQAAPICEMAIKALRSALDLIENAAVPVLPVIQGYGLLTLGFCNQRLGRRQEALDAFGKALNFDSARPGSLVARGMLIAETDPAAALGDFEEAAESHTPLIAPYIYLAQDALIHRNYERCLELCDKGLERARDPRIQAVLLQWEGIAGAELGGPSEIVRRLFESAMALDPLNLEIQHNFGLVQRRMRTASTVPDPEPWQYSFPPNLEGAEQILSQLPAVA